MKNFGLFASGLALLLLGAAPGPNAPSLPGFPDIKYDASLLEPRGEDGKPLLKIIRAQYLEDRKLIVWLLELQTDIGFEELRTIDAKWYNVGASVGPVALFFDKDRVALYFRELKHDGKLYEGKKGDCIRIVLDGSKGFPVAASMQISRP
jgi:hypothetical protein